MRPEVFRVSKRCGLVRRLLHRNPISAKGLLVVTELIVNLGKD